MGRGKGDPAFETARNKKEQETKFPSDLERGKVPENKLKMWEILYLIELGNQREIQSCRDQRRRGEENRV